MNSTALSLSVPVGSVYFSNVATNNITFGSSTSGSSTTITAIAGGGTGVGVGGVALMGSGTYSQNSGTVAFVNANAVTWDLSANSMHISHGLQYTSATSLITSNAFPLASSTRYYSTTSQFSASFLNTGEAHIRGLGNTATVPFTSGSVVLSGVNLTVNTSQGGGASSASQYLQVSGPSIGYLFFSNSSHSWGSSVVGVSTSIWII